MTDHGRLLRNAFSETRITLPDSGAQIVVMLADAEYMPDFNGLYYSVSLTVLPTVVLSRAAKHARSTFAHELGHALHNQYDARYARRTKEFLEGVAKTIERLHDGNSTAMRDIDMLELLASYPEEYWDCHTSIARMREMRNGENLAIRLWERIRNDIAFAESVVSEECTSVFGKQWCTNSELGEEGSFE